MLRPHLLTVVTVAALAATAVTTPALAADTTTTADTTGSSTGWAGSATSPTDATIRLAPLVATDDAATSSITIDTTQLHQTWRGVGAALTDSSVQLLTTRPDAQALLTDPSHPDGAHLNLIRLPLSATDFSTTDWTWEWDARRNRAVPSAEADAAIDVLADLASFANGIDVIATAWTAPAKMTTSRTLDGGSLRRRSTGDYADMLAAQADYLVGAGVPLSAMTVVNEPGHSGNYPTMTMTDGQLVEVGNALGPRLDDLDVELWAVDHNWSDRDRVDAVLADAPTAWDAAAFHCYSGSPSQMSGLPVPALITECTGTTDGWANTFAWDATNLVVDAAEAGSTGLMMWNLALDPDHGPKAPGGCENCRGLLTIDPASGVVEPTPEYFTLAHLARAAQPGSVRATTHTTGNVIATAFVQHDGTIGVFGHNASATDEVVVVNADGGTPHRFVAPAGALFNIAGPVVGTPPPPLPVDAGDIAVDEAGTRWFIVASGTGTGLERQAITSDQTFACDAARGGDQVVIDNDTLNRVPLGPSRADTECIVRAPEGDAHVITTGGIRQWIPDGATWFCELDRGLEVINTTRDHIDPLPEGAWRSCL